MICNQINIHSLISANIFGIKTQYQNMSRESQCAPSHESHWCFLLVNNDVLVKQMLPALLTSTMAVRRMNNDVLVKQM